MEARKRVAVLFGGRSTEYRVSLQSAAALIAAVDRSRWEAVPVGLSQKTGSWYLYQGPVARIKTDGWMDPALVVPCFPTTNASAPGLCRAGEKGLETLRIDAALPVLHGRFGEDGTVQGALELAGIPVIGCGVRASAIGMDKDLSHRLAAAAGIAVPASGRCGGPHVLDEARAAAGRIGYPVFVKPNRAGSSFGIARVETPDELGAAVAAALEHDADVLVEEAVDGFEVGCAVMGPDAQGALTLGEPDEIELARPGSMFDYHEKYTLETSRIHTPARIPAADAARVKDAAERVYRAIGCRGFARVDFFLRPDGELVFNEVNTIPGLTSHSRFPRMLAAAGMGFEDVVEKILEDGCPR